MSFDLWKLELLVVWVHFADLVFGRCAKDFDDFYELVDATVTGEYWLT